MRSENGLLIGLHLQWDMVPSTARGKSSGERWATGLTVVLGRERLLELLGNLPIAAECGDRDAVHDVDHHCAMLVVDSEVVIDEWGRLTGWQL